MACPIIQASVQGYPYEGLGNSKASHACSRISDSGKAEALDRRLTDGISWAIRQAFQAYAAPVRRLILRATLCGWTWDVRHREHHISISHAPRPPTLTVNGLRVSLSGIG